MYALRHSAVAIASRPRSRLVVARAEPSTAVVEAPVASTSSSADGDLTKVKATISSLDLLVPEPPKPVRPPPSERPAAPKTVSSPIQLPGLSLPDAKKGQSGVKSGSFSGAGRGELSWEQIMGFEGVAPELINARCAMIGFMAAIISEINTGESVFAQMVSGGLGDAFLVFLAVTVASFAPAVRGIAMKEVFNQDPKKVKSFGPFTPAAELSNGRAAMVAFLVVVLLEGAAGTAFFL